MEPTARDASAEVMVCRELRTRMYYVMGHDHEDLRVAAPNAQYWCARTMTVLGPDDVYCSPGNCQSHRGCFDPQE